MTQKPRILAVDDDPDSLEMLNDVLGSTFRLTLCETPKAALKALDHEEFDAVLTDHAMDEMTGLQLSRLIFNKVGALPVVILTGAGTYDLALRAVKSNIFDMLIKPAGEDELRDSIMKAVDHRRILESIEEAKWNKRQAEYLTHTSSLISSLTHEIYNSISVLDGNAGIIQKCLEREPVPLDKIGNSAKVIKDWCETVETQVNRISQLMSVGKRQHEHYLKSIIADAQPTLKPYALRFGLEIEFPDIPDDFIVFVNDSQLVHAVVAVVKNAIEAVHSLDGHEGWVKLDVEEQDHVLILKVSDSGSGLTEEERLQAFEPGFSTKSRSDHKGLGLSLAVVVFSHMGGRLYYDRSTEFTTFVMEIPRARHREKKAS